MIQIHALSGAECLNKVVGTKTRAAKEGLSSHELLAEFGLNPLSAEMIENAEKFFKVCYEE